MRALEAHLAVVPAVAVAACLAATSAAPTATAGPERVAFSGTLVYCSAIGYPPEEFYQGVVIRGRELRPKAVGSDIDIGSEVAKRLGVKATFVNTQFSTIIPALLAEKCDAIISGLSDTKARRARVAFVHYLVVGQSLMVAKGNPKRIQTPADLSGKSVSVELGTTNETFLRGQNRKLQRAGKRPTRIVTFSADTAAADALKAGKVDAYFGDAPVVAYYVAHSGSFAVAGRPVNPLPVGIALRKGDSRIPRVRQAIREMYADGTMKRILARWKLSAFALRR
jgi:polar amino acid transport system substrate-binding protein